jgi:hypothetical protein
MAIVTLSTLKTPENIVITSPIHISYHLGAAHRFALQLPDTYRRDSVNSLYMLVERSEEEIFGVWSPHASMSWRGHIDVNNESPPPRLALFGPSLNDVWLRVIVSNLNNLSPLPPIGCTYEVVRLSSILPQVPK